MKSKICLLAFLVITIFTTGCNRMMNNSKSQTEIGNFVLEGTITKISNQEIPNKAKGGKSRYETWIQIEATDPQGASFVEEFAGPPEICQNHSIGEHVRIEATTKSGRHIASISTVK